MGFKFHIAAMRVICGDGSEVRVPKRCFGELRLFKNPSVVAAGSYTLKCKARPQVMNLLLDHVDDESEVNITDGNFEELQSLCRELEFSGLDAELSEYASRFKARRRIEKPAPPPMKEVETFEYQRGKGFHGIIAYLTRKFGGNVLEKGVINIMGSGKNDGAVVDFSSDEGYGAFEGYLDPWICFDFNK